MLDYNPRVKSAFVDYLYRSRGNERIPIREFAFEMDQRLFLLAHAQSLFQRALAQGLLLLSEDDGLAPPGIPEPGRLFPGEAGDGAHGKPSNCAQWPPDIKELPVPRCRLGKR